jgi:hypothetical protein
LVAQALRDFESVYGVCPVEVLGHEFGFVALHGANAMPHQGVCATLQSGDFVYPFLDVVLPKIALTTRRHLAHIVGAEGFRDGQQLHRIDGSTTRHASRRNTRLHDAELVA